MSISSKALSRVGSVVCAASLSTLADARQAAREASAACRKQLPAVPDLALLFVSPHHADALEAIVGPLCEDLATDQLLACTGESIVGGDREIEKGPALSLWLARLPGADVSTMHLRYERSLEGGAIVGWPDDWPGPREPENMLVLGEPFSFPADLMLDQLREDRPGLIAAGGMASGASRPGENRLAIGRHVFDEGAAVAAISAPPISARTISVRTVSGQTMSAKTTAGSPSFRTVVSQGCRPIGRPMVITRAERNVIFDLGGKPALLQLQSLFRELPTSEQRLVQTGLHVGRVIDEYRDTHEQGDFLVRNVVAIDRQSGAIAIGDVVRPGQTVQFHVRDAETADHELNQLLAQARDEKAADPCGYAGGLLFTCNGRGTRMFPDGHHDARAIGAALGPVPLAGFFAAGEIGPVGGQNFVHGFTASLALFG